MEIITPISIPKKVFKRVTFFLDVYKVNIELFIMRTNKDVAYKMRQLCKKYKVDDSDTSDEAVGYVATFTPEGAGIFYIVLSLESVDVNTITHETDHLRSYIMKHQGLMQDGGEASANLNGFINEKIFGFLHKHNIPITY